MSSSISKMEVEETNSGSSDEEVEMTNKVLENQRHVFEQMTEMLKVQQEALKQNLQVLQAKAKKPVSHSKEKNADQVKYSSEEKLGRLEGSTTPGRNDKSDKVSDDGGVRHWSQAGSKNYDAQICPICGAEFDDPENPDALEEHVAGHWCSSESN